MADRCSEVVVVKTGLTIHKFARNLQSVSFFANATK
jgi:hypothetical protein